VAKKSVKAMGNIREERIQRKHPRQKEILKPVPRPKGLDLLGRRYWNMRAGGAHYSTILKLERHRVQREWGVIINSDAANHVAMWNLKRIGITIDAKPRCPWRAIRYNLLKERAPGLEPPALYRKLNLTYGQALDAEFDRRMNTLEKLGCALDPEIVEHGAREALEGWGIRKAKVRKKNGKSRI